MSNTLLPDLINFPMNCIYGLLDDKNGVLLQFTNNSIQHLAINVTELRKGIHDCKPLQDAYNQGVLQLKIFKVFEKPFTDLIARAECALIIKSGYTDYSGIYTNTKYSVTKQVKHSYINSSHAPLVYILIKSHSQGAIVAGIFDNMLKADEWISANYPNPGEIDTLVFADNELSAAYRDRHGYKIVHTRPYKERGRILKTRRGWVPPLS